MKNINNAIATIALVGIIGIGTAFGQKADLPIGFAETDNQQQCTENNDNTDWGILLSEFASGMFGNIGVGFSGSSSEKVENVQVNCGILLSE